MSFLPFSASFYHYPYLIPSFSIVCTIVNYCLHYRTYNAFAYNNQFHLFFRFLPSCPFCIFVQQVFFFFRSHHYTFLHFFMYNAFMFNNNCCYSSVFGHLTSLENVLFFLISIFMHTCTVCAFVVFHSYPIFSNHMT